MNETVYPNADWKYTAQTADGKELAVLRAVYHGQDITFTIDEKTAGESVLIMQTAKETEKATEPDLFEESDGGNPGDAFSPRLINIGNPDPEIVDRFEKVRLEDFVYTNDQGEEYTAEFVYYIYVPEEAKTRSVPIIIALNGMGECGTNGSNLTANRMATCWINEKWQADHPCIVAAPQAPVPFLNTKTIRAIPDLMAAYVERLKPLFDELIETYNSDKVYLTGVSMGAMTAYAFMSIYPDYHFDACLLCCGYADGSDPSAIKGQTIYIVSDSADASVSPAGVMDTYNTLADSGENDITLVYSYMNYGHHIWDYVYDNPEFMEWLFRQ